MCHAPSCVSAASQVDAEGQRPHSEPHVVDRARVYEDSEESLQIYRSGPLVRVLGVGWRQGSRLWACSLPRQTREGPSVYVGMVGGSAAQGG